QAPMALFPTASSISISSNQNERLTTMSNIIRSRGQLVFLRNASAMFSFLRSWKHRK
ncbi:18760_t:CDS:2, partial [Gigaspora rosea]